VTPANPATAEAKVVLTGRSAMNASTTRISSLIHDSEVQSTSKISSLIDVSEVRSGALVWIISLLGTGLLAFIVCLLDVTPAWD
jgi:hypothetical protein